MSERIARELLDHIAEGLGPSRPPDLDAATPLLETRILDSTGILDLAQFIEEQYGVTVADDELHPNNFGSVDALVVFVRRKLGQES